MEIAKQRLNAHVALSTCLGSAGWGAAAIYGGSPNITLIAFSAAAAWLLAAFWLGRPAASRLPQLVRVMTFGGALLAIMGLAVLFVP